MTHAMNDSHAQTGPSNGVVSGDWLAVFKATLKALEDAAADAGSYGPSEADEDYAKAIKDAKDFLANVAGQPRDTTP